MNLRHPPLNDRTHMLVQQFQAKQPLAQRQQLALGVNRALGDKDLMAQLQIGKDHRDPVGAGSGVGRDLEQLVTQFTVGMHRIEHCPHAPAEAFTAMQVLG